MKIKASRIALVLFLFGNLFQASSISSQPKYPTRVYWGDTHLHTSQSLDARALGDTLGPEAAFRFARGEEVVSATGQRAKLSRPLDFLVIADHSEAFGMMDEIVKGNPQLMSDPTTRRWHDMIRAGGEESFKVAGEIIQGLGLGKTPEIMKNPKIIRNLWNNYLAIAEKMNDPNQFTALLGYEWTSNNKGNNLHRVVIFRDGADKVGKFIPFSSLDSENPEDLWKVLAAYEKNYGVQVLAIPHNGNLSNGRMFALADFLGNPLTRKYAENRARWEPIYEVTQIKGDGEAHKFLSPNDEFASYEIWDKGNLDLSEKKKPEMLQFEYAREGLKTGLKLQEKLGTNPFKVGMIGSTDSHTSLATADEDNFFGKHSGKEPSAHRWDNPVLDFGGVKILGWEMAASGYAAVWSTANTREALWDAMKRKEVYGTTGPRMTVRFFGGYDFKTQESGSQELAMIGYSKGVPMGGDLRKASPGKSPTFLIAALKDPMGANLDRVQVIKGWLDQKGEVHEKIYDVAVSDGRPIESDGRCKKPVGSTVNVKNATYTNSIGDPELRIVWKDPDFNPALKAFYYVRVIEIPTPRWTAYDAKRYGIKMAADVPMTTQERGYTSPIWYNP